jgi:glutathione S-transferase
LKPYPLREQILHLFHELSERLETRPYLCSDSFSAADLTLASLGGALVGITQDEGYGGYLPGLVKEGGDPEAIAYSQVQRHV